MLEFRTRDSTLLSGGGGSGLLGCGGLLRGCFLGRRLFGGGGLCLLGSGGFLCGCGLLCGGILLLGCLIHRSFATLVHILGYVNANGKK